MARKKKPEEHENHERWLVSYADFITLLFAFFVVMYSISSVNEGKYRVLSDSLVAAFRSSAKSMEPIQVGQSAKRSANVKPVPMPMKGNLSKTSDKVGRSIVPQLMSGEEAKTLGEIQGQIEDAMKSLIDEELISLRRGENFLEVIINSNILFPSGSSILSNDATVILADLADVLSKYANFLHVEGYTDNVPINNIIYPSNWELSAARAASVVHLFSDRGVKPELMAAIGFGEYRPTEDNASAAGRQANRRVVVVVMGPTGAQEQLDLQRHEGGEAQAAAPKPAPPPGMVDVQLPVEVYESLPNDIANILRPGEAPLAGDENTTVPPSDVVEIVPPGTINPIELPAIEPAGER